MSRKARKFKDFFRPKLGDLQKKKKNKKKKGLRQNPESFFGRNPKFKVFFRPKLGDLQKKKKKKRKRSSPKFRVIFLPISQIQTFEGGLFPYGGELFSIFHRKSASKPQKTCDFAYFTSQWGGSSPPHPPLATLLLLHKAGGDLACAESTYGKKIPFFSDLESYFPTFAITLLVYKNNFIKTMAHFCSKFKNKLRAMPVFTVKKQ